MHKFATLNCLIDSTETIATPNNGIQNLRHAVLLPIGYKPNILRALRGANFKYHRSCSLSNLIRDCSVGEGQTFLMFWGCERFDNRITTSMSTSSCSTVHVSPTVTNVNAQEKEIRSVCQQTDISCRYSPSICSPANINELTEQRVMITRIADSLTFSSPNSPPLVQSSCRSNSILGSVCALLLSKQGSTVAPKPVSSVTDSIGSDNICRICFGGDSGERLVRPCSCRGTIAAVHRSCLERWLLQAATSYCELCRHHYIVTRSHKWTWIQSAWEWARSGRGRALVADAWRAAALGALSVVGTARALHAADRALQVGAKRGGAAALAANFISSLLIGIIGALNGLLTTWMLLKIQEHQSSWQVWRDSTLHVHVTLSEEETESGHPSDTTIVADGPSPTSDRSTNIADPFMVAPLLEP